LALNGYVQKPVKSNEFLAAARALGVYWLGITSDPDPEPTDGVNGRQGEGVGPSPLRAAEDEPAKPAAYVAAAPGRGIEAG
jgi:hypothetical protein